MQLNSLKAGNAAIIASIDAEQALYLRLNALGFRPGKRLQVIRQAAFHGPLHVRIGSTDIIIRQRDAQAIRLDPASLLTQESHPA